MSSLRWLYLIPWSLRIFDTSSSSWTSGIPWRLISEHTIQMKPFNGGLLTVIKQQGSQPSQIALRITNAGIQRARPVYTMTTTYIVLVLLCFGFVYPVLGDARPFLLPLRLYRVHMRERPVEVDKVSALYLLRSRRQPLHIRTRSSRTAILVVDVFSCNLKMFFRPNSSPCRDLSPETPVKYLQLRISVLTISGDA